MPRSKFPRTYVKTFLVDGIKVWASPKGGRSMLSDAKLFDLFTAAHKIYQEGVSGVREISERDGEEVAIALLFLQRIHEKSQLSTSGHVYSECMRIIEQLNLREKK